MTVKNTFYEKLADFKELKILHDDDERRCRVCRARCRYSNAIVELKSYAIDSKRIVRRSAVDHEIEITARPGCPFIQQCFDHFVDVGRHWLVQEYCAGGSLKQILATYHSDIEEGWIASQTLDFLYEKGMVHTRVSPSTILFNSGRVAKLTGFENSCLQGQGLRPLVECLDSLPYQSPEIVSATVQSTADHKMDAWSLGAITYEIVFGVAPFADPSEEQHRRNILSKEIVFRWPVSAELMDFIKKALCRDYRKRASAAELLSHPWIQTNMNWESPMDFDDPVIIGNDLQAIHVHHNQVSSAPLSRAFTSETSLRHNQKMRTSRSTLPLKCPKVLATCIHVCRDGQKESSWRRMQKRFFSKGHAPEQTVEDSTERIGAANSFRVVMDHPSTLKNITLPFYTGFQMRKGIERATSEAASDSEVSFSAQNEAILKMKTPRAFTEDFQKKQSEREHPMTNPTPPPIEAHRPSSTRSPSTEDPNGSPSLGSTLQPRLGSEELWTEEIERILDWDTNSP